jgi:hypothetical protein
MCSACVFGSGLGGCPIGSLSFLPGGGMGIVGSFGCVIAMEILNPNAKLTGREERNDE